MDKDDEGKTIACGEFFVAREVPVEKIVVTEGALFIAEPGELSALEHRLSPSGKAGLTAFLEMSGRNYAPPRSG